MKYIYVEHGPARDQVPMSLGASRCSNVAGEGSKTSGAKYGLRALSFGWGKDCTIQTTAPPNPRSPSCCQPSTHSRRRPPCQREAFRTWPRHSRLRGPSCAGEELAGWTSLRGQSKPEGSARHRTVRRSAFGSRQGHLGFEKRISTCSLSQDHSLRLWTHRASRPSTQR